MFEEPVTEAIAPGYFEVVDKPMDYQTVEKKVEEQAYKSKEEVTTTEMVAIKVSSCVLVKVYFGH